jgi:hypothetical protein
MDAGPPPLGNVARWIANATGEADVPRVFHALCRSRRGNATIRIRHIMEYLSIPAGNGDFYAASNVMPSKPGSTCGGNSWRKTS